MTLKVECCENKNGKLVSIQQRKSIGKVIIVNDNQLNFKLVTVDGCQIRNSTSADFILSLENSGDLIIELKGKNISHAIQQIEATAKYWTENSLKVGKLSALVVSTQYPRENTTIERAAQALRKKYQTRLKIKNILYQGTFESLFS